MGRLRTLAASFIFIVFVYWLGQVEMQVGGTGLSDDILNDISFVDDVGNVITLDVLPERIVSLSSIHTENIYALEGEVRLAGVSFDSIFPYEAMGIERYDVSRIRDMDRLIESSPDMVLVEPAMNRTLNRQISQIEGAGIRVVSLMPEDLDEFGGYIRKLGMILGREEAAKEKLKTFYGILSSYELNSLEWAKRLGNVNVFVESGQVGYVTPTEGSLVGRALDYAGLKSVIGHSHWLYEEDMSQIIDDTKMQSYAEDISLFISLKGGGYSGSDRASVMQNPLLAKSQAVMDGQVYEVPGAIVGQYTFRFTKGIRELQRIAARQNMTERDAGLIQNRIEDLISQEAKITRGEMAGLLYDSLNLPTFAVTDESYYEHKKYRHTYGAYEDVKWSDEDYDAIETVTMLYYLDPIIDADGREWFRRDDAVSRDELMKISEMFNEDNEQ